MLGYIRLPLRNAYNARDLGGYACDGGTTNWRAFVRTDALDNLDDWDIQFLKDYGIRTVIDLRSADELEKEPDPDALKAFASYIHIPLLTGNVMDAVERPDVPPEHFLCEIYLAILRDARKAVCAVMEAMADAAAGGILFHCAGGKDRTGVIAALLLGLAGVAQADILSNYEVTYTFLQQDPSMMDRETNYPDIPVEYMYSWSTSLQPGLAYIQSFGGAYDYLKSLGVGDATLQTLKNRLHDDVSVMPHDPPIHNTR